MDLARIAVIGSSWKRNEKRLPIHPDHLSAIPQALRRRMAFERGYARSFGLDDAVLAAQSGGVGERGQLLSESDLVILPKPLAADLAQMKEGAVLWGWAHAVQQADIAQQAIDRKLTLITWESMNHWAADGSFQSHVFAGNNELAGYAGVIHALSLRGMCGHYGPRRKVAVFHWGAVSRGAVRALLGLGFEDITVLVRAMPEANPEERVSYRVMNTADPKHIQITGQSGSSPLINLLAECDLIVNGIFQDTDRPLMFVNNEEVGRLRPRCLIIDISCDAGMAFPFAQPTSFDRPILKLGQIDYYAVDHVPSYLWDSASWEISSSLLPYLETVAAGPERWAGVGVIAGAVEIERGLIRNRRILSFQGRQAQYPHAVVR